MRVSPGRQVSGVGYVTAVLIFVTALAFLDRQLPNLIVQPLKDEFGLSDTQIGLLQGYSFAFFYTLMGLPFGYLVDRANRRNLILAGIILWSALTVLSGFAETFWHLLIARMGVAIGEACLIPAACSIIGDYVDDDRRGRVLGLYYASLPIGVGVSLAAGAIVIGLLGTDAINLPILGDIEPWRVTFLVAGVPGIVGALLIMTLREPIRRAVSLSAREAGTSLADLIAYLRANRATFGTIFSCYTLFSFVSFATTPWIPTYYLRTFGQPVSESGILVGAMTVIVGIGGSLLGGWLSDRWQISLSRGGRLRGAVLGWMLILPGAIAWPLMPTVGASYFPLALLILGSALGSSSLAAVVQAVTPNEMRGRVMAISLTLSGLLGFGLGPLATAWIAEHIIGGENGLRWSMLLVASPASVAGTIIAIAGLGAYARTARALPDMISDVARR